MTNLTRAKTGLDPRQPADDVSISPIDDDYHVKINYGNRVQATWAFITEFCANSSVHGVRYFTERERHWSERLWWFGAFIVALVVCGSLINNVYTKWDQSPVIVSFAEKLTPVWEIPFPAVTICPDIKTNIEYLDFSQTFENMMNGGPPYSYMSNNEIARMEAVVHICYAHWGAMLDIGENFTDHSIFRRIEEVAPTFKETMYRCKWRTQKKVEQNFPLEEDIFVKTIDNTSRCTLFRRILTDEGICYTFNALNSDEIYRDGMNENLKYVRTNSKVKDWNLEDGYAKSIPLDNGTYPYRVHSPGILHGLNVQLRLFERHLDHMCRGLATGFKMILHPPHELPQVSTGYRIPYQTEFFIAVTPNKIKTSEGLRNYDPNQRQCFFRSERELKFFRNYTQHNCELECLSNFTKAKCGCVKFSLPRDTATKICGAANIKCYTAAEENLKLQKFMNNTSDDIEKVKSGCNCLPSCTSITYDAEISQARFEWYKLPIPGKDVIGYQKMELARLKIFFKTGEFITLKRSELYGPTDFFASCGGLLGLFMGVSLLSIVEVIYYATLRLCCSLRIRLTTERRLRVAAV